MPRPGREPFGAATATSAAQSGRDTTIDGFRALAVCGVVVAHAVNYRFDDQRGFVWHYLRRFAEPMAQTSVLLFFVISGFIITALLLREERRTGGVGIRAFYIRRAFRILPPLIAYYLALVAMRATGTIALDDASLAASALFGCNTGIVDCDWWVAHTWSLAVEEQFYLLWPILFAFLPPGSRAPLLAAALVAMLTAFFLTPLVWHSNYISFSCIAVGALCAVSTRLHDRVRRSVRPLPWLGVIAVMALGPLTPANKVVQALMPFGIIYLMIGAREIAPVRAVLSARPLQLVALGSYSLYLWQQLFLAKPELFAGSPPPLILLPLVVVASVLLVEQPLIRVGHALSRRGRTPPDAAAPRQDLSADADLLGRGGASPPA